MLEGLECLRCWTDHPTWTRFSRNNYTQWVSRCGLASNSVTWLEICFLFCFFFPSAWEGMSGFCVHLMGPIVGHGWQYL